MKVLITIFGFFCLAESFAQSNVQSSINMPVPNDRGDSIFVLRHTLRNDIRIFYGVQANSMMFGSLNDDSPELSGDLYKNLNDFIGVGVTYKWIDWNLYFGLPGTTYFNQERSNLKQFSLAISSTGNQFAFRGYLRDTKGVIAEAPETGYESTPSLHEFKIGAQLTYIFNSEEYSYRAALFQSELQKRTAASFMIRAEPFYRQLGAKEGIVSPAYDTEERFDDQKGLTYLHAPGLMVLPGYGATFSWKQGHYFLSPMLFAGPGVAFNTYISDNGRSHKTNMEWAGSVLVNGGYNGSRMYCKVETSFSIAYTKINPAYLFAKNLEVELLFGYRFFDLESWLPRSFKKGD